MISMIRSASEKVKKMDDRGETDRGKKLGEGKREDALWFMVLYLHRV